MQKGTSVAEKIFFITKKIKSVTEKVKPVTDLIKSAMNGIRKFTNHPKSESELMKNKGVFQKSGTCARRDAPQNRLAYPMLGNLIATDLDT